MSKADNMLAILWLLKTRRRRTAKELAEELEMSVRTVYRYIDALCASGVPIVSDAGHNGGYSLPDHFNDAPLFFDLEEQKALVHAAAFAREAGYPNGEALNRAVAKLKRYASEEQKQELNRQETGVDAIHPHFGEEQETALKALEAAMADGCTVRLDYRKSYGQAVKRRDIDPYGLVHWKSKWYVVGFCRLRSTIRSFRVDRIEGDVVRTGERYERPADFSPREALLRDLLPGRGKEEALVTVRIQGRESAIDDLCAHWFLGHAVAERSASEAVFRLDENAAFSRMPYLLMAYGGTIRVAGPPAMKDAMVRAAARLHEYYESM
ncbi:helix-turn-helix transcriptional regulator [Paenibacillus humicola]|uniref:helix-turn-helix transcriptional regulator n=1 Tax=Paenibacillus humicola TaxID=3110540 RepID=UPI00237B0A34|nr:YafY family protein [Paenibacillus humicola]